MRSLDRLDDIDTVINVETLRFDDATYTVKNDLSHIQIATLYQQVLGRQAEIGGFQYWAERSENGLSLGQMAMLFLYSAEYAGGKGSNFDSLSQSAQVDLLYHHFLQREAEPAGHDHWMEKLTAGMSMADVASFFVGSEEMQAAYVRQEGWDFIL